MKKQVLVKSTSRPEPYTVAVSRNKQGVSLSCDCPAGIWGKLCKHKLAVVKGDQDILYDSQDIVTLNQIGAWVADSSYPQLLADLELANSRVEDAQKKLRDLKAKIGRVMTEGIG